MRPIFISWLEDYSRDVMKMGRSFRKHALRWAAIDPSDEQVRYLKAIENEDWARLSKLATQELKARQNSIRTMLRQQGLLKRQFNRLPNAYDAARHTVAPKDRENYQENRQKIRQKLLNNGIPNVESQQLLAVYDQLDPRQIPKTLEFSLDRYENILSENFVSHLAAASGASLALAVAKSNELVDYSIALVDTPGDYVDFVTNDLDDDESEIWRVLRKNDLFEVWGLATQLRQRSGRRLLAGAIPHATALALQRKENPDNGTLGEASLAVGTLIRRLLRSIALGRTLEFASRWHTKNPFLRDWINATSKTSISGAAFKWPNKVTPRSLSMNGGRYDGESRTVSGKVTQVEITHQGRKAISKVHIENGGHSVAAVLPYIKVDSSGLVPGAWCKIAGVWNENPTEANHPALLIDRLAQQDLGKTGWRECSNNLLAPIFTPVAHGLAIEWSWELGTNGAGNQLRYDTWYSTR